MMQKTPDLTLHDNYVRVKATTSRPKLATKKTTTTHLDAVLRAEELVAGVLFDAEVVADLQTQAPKKSIQME